MDSDQSSPDLLSIKGNLQAAGEERQGGINILKKRKGEWKEKWRVKVGKET